MRAVLLASLIALGLLGGRGAQRACAEEPAPAPPATYADRDATWWVGELGAPTTREVATGALRKIGRAGLPALLGAWEGADAGARQALLTVLRGLEGPIPELAEALPRMLDGQASEAQALGLLALVRTAGVVPATLELLARLGGHASRTVREAAAATLRDLPLAPQLMGEALARLLASPEPAIVERALEALQRLGPEARHAIPVVDELLLRPEERTPRVLAAAFATLRAMRPGAPFDTTTYVHLLEAHIGGADPTPLLALASEQDATPPLVSLLAKATSHPDATVRRRAGEVLASLRFTPALLTPELFGLLASPEPDVVLGLLAGLRRLGPAAGAAQGPVVALLERDGAWLDVVAVQALATLRTLEAGGERVLDVAAHLAVHAADPVALEAVQLLAAQEPDEPAVADRLLEVAGGRDAAVRTAALQALGKRKRPLPEEAPVLRRLLQGSDVGAHVEVAQLLARVGSRDGALLELLGGHLAQRPGDGGLREGFVRLARDDPDRALELEPRLEPSLWGALLEAFLKEPGNLAREPRGSLAVVAFDRWLSTDAARVAPRQVASLLQQARLAPQEPQALEVLGRWLDHPTAEVADAAVRALAASPAGEAHRLRMLTSPDVARRRAALRELGWRARRDLPPGAREWLEAALEDEDQEVRASTALWLAAHLRGNVSPITGPAPLPGKPESLARAALDVLRLDRPPERARALELYVQVGVPLAEALPLLRDLLGEEARDLPPNLLARALALTSEWADARVLETLRADLTGADLVRRVDALLVFAQWRAETALVLGALPDLIRHPSSRVALRALAACEALGPTASALAPVLIERVEQGEALAHLGETVRALVAVAPGEQGGLVAVRRWWLDPERAWRLTALPPVLVRMGPAGAHLFVDGLADPALREASLKGLRDLGPSATPALPRLREALAARPDDAVLRALVTSLDAR